MKGLFPDDVMQIIVPIGGIICLIILVYLMTRKGGSAYKYQAPRAASLPPYTPGGSSPLSVDVSKDWYQPEITPTQAANRRELAQGARLADLTDQDLQLLRRPNAHLLEPGEPSIQVIMTRRHGSEIQQFYDDESG